MAVTVQGGFGFQIKLHIGTATPWTVVANVIDEAYSKQKAYTAESTGHDAAGGYLTRVKTGKREMEPFTLLIGWDTDDISHAALVTAFDSDLPIAIQAQDPDGDEITSMNVLVVGLGRVGKQDGVFTCAVDFEPTGAPTIT